MSATPALSAQRLDHLVLTVADIDRSVDFYTAALGMEKIEFGESRIALAFGQQKINLHQSGREFTPNAARVQPGSADLCFIVDCPVADALLRLQDLNIDVIEGPVRRSGALGSILSLYFRDPDGNLIEVASYVEE